MRDLQTSTVARSVLLALIACLPAAGGEDTRPERDRLYPVSFLMSPSSIAVAPDGTPHVLYPSTDDLPRHAWLEDGVWRDEPVDTRLSSFGPRSIAVDSLGRPHVAYLADVLVHGVRGESGWVLTDVAPTSGGAGIALLPGDRPGILHDRPDGNLEVLIFDGSAWTVIDTGLTGVSEYRHELAFDGEGNCHLLFQRLGVLRHATNASGSWVESSFPGSFSGALALDAAGHPHVLTVGSTTTDDAFLLHFQDDGTGWRSEEILPHGDPFPSRAVNGLHFDSAGHLFAAFSDLQYIRYSPRAFPRFVHHDGTGWRSPYSIRRPDATVYSSALGPRGELLLSCAGDPGFVLTFSLPDLSAAWAALETHQRGAGAQAAGTLRIRNLGAGRSQPTRVAFYLSDDDLVDEGDDPVGRTRRLDTIGPGRERSFPVSIALPADAAGRRLLAVVDPDARRDDIDRPNNTAVAVVGE